MSASFRIHLHLKALFLVSCGSNMLTQPTRIHTSRNTMSTRHLLRHIFRRSPRAKVSEDALPLDVGKLASDVASLAIEDEPKLAAAIPGNRQISAPSTSAPPPKTPEPFGLEEIAEEDYADTPASIDAASLTETLNSLDLEISTFTTRELVCATLDEAKMVTHSHLDTIDTTLALLNALDGFSATIPELKREMLEKKQAYEEKTGMLEAVERAVKGMIFAGEAQVQEAMNNAVK